MSQVVNKSTNSKANKYRCVNCGHQVNELVHEYSPTVQKLTECQNCHLIADPLIEFDNLYKIINLILLSSISQRHILHNTTCKNLYKIFMIVTLLESYFLWNEISHNTKRNSSISASILLKDPLFMEKGFYISTLQIVLSNLTLFTIIRLVSMCTRETGASSNCQSTTLDLFNGFILASTAKFFFLPIIIWNENISEVNRVIHLTLVSSYFLISLIYVHSNICKSSKMTSASIILLAFIVNKYMWLKLSFVGIL